MILPNDIQYGPKLTLSNEIDQMKYRQTGEDFSGKCTRLANTLKDSDMHFDALREIFREMRFLPAGRVQNAIGAARQTTAYNCFVSQVIEDSMESVMRAATAASETMRKGGGIGYDFSRLRPRGDLIKSLDSRSSGPVSFMGIFDAVCQTIASSGHRRGAQMGVLRVDHPDIMEFVTSKQNSDKLTGFNISVGITDNFMKCLIEKTPFDLTFDGRVYDNIDPVNLWDVIMRSTWDYAEPGVLFIDTINDMNNLQYCETIEATNPCGEQPLPPYGACLLGSFNLTKYINNKMDDGFLVTLKSFDYKQFTKDIHNVVRAMDNVIDRTIYPLPEQEKEAREKRRMGLGVTGLANTGEMLGLKYGTMPFLAFTTQVLTQLRDETYHASTLLAEEKGSFPAFDRNEYMNSPFVKTLPDWLQETMWENGMRNSHLTSIAPTGTISIVADNVSSGIEPPYMLSYDRTIRTFDGDRVETVNDYAHNLGIDGVTADECTAQQHLDVLVIASRFVDSAVSKTCNIGDDVSYDDFKTLYMDAWRKGCKGITTFRKAGKRRGILNATPDAAEVAEACFIDPATGQRTCD